MKIAILPFFSQRDKRTNQLLLDSCCTCQISFALARSLSHLPKHFQVTLALPGHDYQWTEQAAFAKANPDVQIRTMYVPETNILQRLSVPVPFLAGIAGHHQVVISNHELWSWHLKQLNPNLHVIQLNFLSPFGEWAWMLPMQLLSWRSADCVAFLSKMLREVAFDDSRGAINYAPIWPLIIDDVAIPPGGWPPPEPRPIDLLFVQRCSSNNYTHHLEFLKAVDVLRARGWMGRVAFTDPTGYLEMTKIPLPFGVEFLHATERSAYYKALRETRFAIALMEDDFHGGVAIREAIASGALPILLQSGTYENLVGNFPWPGFISGKVLKDPETFATRLADVMANSELLRLGEQIYHLVRKESYRTVIHDHVVPYLKGLEKVYA